LANKTGRFKGTLDPAQFLFCSLAALFPSHWKIPTWGINMDTMTIAFIAAVIVLGLAAYYVLRPIGK
jgi:hypothetical protein